MILQNAIGFESDIKSLLEKSMLNMNKNQIKAWMKYEFDPSTMYCYVVDNTVVSCLQMKRRVFSYHQQNGYASVFTMAATLPDYRQKGYFTKLLDAALNQSANNDLISVVYTTFPKLFESRSFTPVSKTQTYWLPSYKCTEGNDKNIVAYNTSHDLYPVYTQFISCFDGSIVYTKEQFNEQIQFFLSSQKKIAIIQREKEIKGFVVYEIINNYTKIHHFIYLDSQAIYDVFRYLSIRTTAISFTVSQFERFEKLFLLDYPRNEGTVLVRLHNYKLFSKWCGLDIRNAAQIFEELDAPIWMQMIE